MKYLSKLNWQPALITLILGVTNLSAQEDSVDIYIKKNLQSHHIPGLTLAVINNNKIIKTGAYGFSNLEHRVPAQINTVYEIGSITKQFTAIAIMMLVEDKKLQLETRISDFFPGCPAFWKQIRIRHLLSHTSGIQNHVAIPGYLGMFKTNILSESFPSQKDILKAFFKLPKEFEPGATWSYDNTGYYLLGWIIDQISGQSYWDFLQTRIFNPLGMKNTHNTDIRTIIPNRASGYLWLDSIYQNQPVLLPFIAYSAGSIISTVGDMALWNQALETEQLIKKASLQQVWTPTLASNGQIASLNYGFGWFIDKYEKHRIHQHTGGTPGFSSVFYRFPDDSLAIIILTNHADKVLDQLAIDIAGIYKPSLSRPVKGLDPSPATTSHHKAVFSNLLQSKYDSSHFTQPMKIFLKTATGKGLFQWYASHGKLNSFIFSHLEKENGITTIRYRVKLGDNFFWFSFRVTETGRIAQICFS